MPFASPQDLLKSTTPQSAVAPPQILQGRGAAEAGLRLSIMTARRCANESLPPLSLANGGGVDQWQDGVGEWRWKRPLARF